MRKFLSAASLFLLILLLFSCATSGRIPRDGDKYGVIKYNQKKYDAAFEAENYSTCIAMLHDKNKSGRDIRDNLDEAMLCYLNQDYETSIKVFDLTDALMQEALTKSITKTTGSTIFNDNISEYTGNIYEYLLLNAFNAMNFIQLGDLENAIVELNKAGIKENEYIAKYGEVELKDAISNEDSEKFNSSVTKLGLNLSELKADSPKKANINDLYKDSPLLRYLSLILYSANGNRSNVEIDAKMLASLGSEINVSEDVDIPAGKGRLNVLALSGLIGRRHEAKFETPRILPFYVPIDGAKPILFKLKFTWPEYSGQEASITRIDVEVDGHGRKSAVLVEDFDQALAKDVRLKANKAFTRSMIRSISKKTTALASGEATLIAAKKTLEKADNSILRAAAEITYVTAWHTIEYAVDAIDLSEFADIRQAYIFPRAASAAGFSLDPGYYSGKVIYYNGNSKLYEDKFENVEVKLSRPNLVLSSFFD